MATSSGDIWSGPDDLAVEADLDLGRDQLGDGVERVGDAGIRIERILPDHWGDVIRRPEIQIVLEHDEIVEADLGVGREGEHDIGIAVDERLVLDAWGDAVDRWRRSRRRSRAVP